MAAYGPYMREIEEWAGLFEEVVIAAPCRSGAGPADCAKVRAGNVWVAPVPELGGRTMARRLELLGGLPRMLWALAKTMRGADAIHVRCPGNVGLVGAVLAPLFSERVIAKYAGQWGGKDGEAWTYRLQKAILRSRWWRGPVIVYGDWPGEPSHVVPFFNSSLTGSQMDRAKRAAASERLEGPRRVLFVGRLSHEKRAETLIRACAQLRREGLPLHCEVVGEGPERERLEDLVRELGLGGQVALLGGLGFEGVLAAYERADLLVLPSETEGWPKVLAEAMAFGVPCVATDRGLNPWMLGEGRGLTARFDDVGGFAEAIRTILTEDDETRRRRREACARFGQQYTIEGVRQGLKEIMERWWGVELRRTET